MELLQVFDKNKNILNESVSRDDKYNLPDGKYFMIVLIFIQNDRGQFLLQKTSKSRHSCFATTGGHVSFGDDGSYTVLKEVKEELGLNISKDKVKYVCTKIFKNCLLETYYSNMNLDINSLSLQTEEVDYVDWFDVEHINHLIDTKEFREGNIEPFREILRYLNKN